MPQTEGVRTRSQHTPGPWQINHRQHGCLYIGSESQPVAITSRGIGKGNEDESMVEADAHLIAAAPALLAACKDALAWLEEVESEDFEGMKESIIRLEETIAAAEGHQAEGRAA